MRLAPGLLMMSMSTVAALSKGTALITGATDGIGKLTSQLLAKEGYAVLLHGRSPERLEAARQSILRATPAAVIETYCYDLSTIASTKQFALDVLSKHPGGGEAATSPTPTPSPNPYPGLDILVQNAGILQPPSGTRELTPDGLEKTFAVNVAAPWVLACLLRPALLRTPNSRMLMVSSISQSDGGRLDVTNLQFSREYDAYLAYGQVGAIP